jgi:hypothetical protein
VDRDSYPVRWAGRQAVVTLPDQIDVSNADQIREELLTIINRGFIPVWTMPLRAWPG